LAIPDKLYRRDVGRLTYINRMVRGAKRPIDCCGANALTGPNRRIRTAWRLRTLFVVAGRLRRTCDGPAVGCKRVSFIPVAIAAIDIIRSSRPDDAVCKRGAKFRDLIEHAHGHLA
jgi:hypothetical protein